MKVVLFCGGLGMRIREYSNQVPKPMVPIGYRPILWHVMKYYAHHGHKDFILCLGYKSDVIKQYFLNYDECLSNNFILSNGNQDVKMLNTDIHDWKITFVDTGIDSNIGQRLKLVEAYLEGEEIFLANYSDGLTDFHLPVMLDEFKESDNIASFLSVQPNLSYHIVETAPDRKVSKIREFRTSDIWINGGYFALRRSIFEYMSEGEELVLEPFARLIAENKLMAFKHDGFWAGMDTFKDKQRLDDMFAHDNAPWQLWNEREKLLKQSYRDISN